MDTVIFTDSLPALKALQSSDSSNLGIDNLALTIDKVLTSYDIKLTLQWIPGHCNLQGNERADRLAKEGARKDQPENPCSYTRVFTGRSLRRCQEAITFLQYRSWQSLVDAIVTQRCGNLSDCPLALVFSAKNRLFSCLQMQRSSISS